MKNKIAQLINIITIVPFIGLIVNTLLFLTRPAIFNSQILWYLLSVVFITLIPVSAYTIEKWIPTIRDAGRKGERKLAFMTALCGFGFGTLVSWISRAPRSVIAIFTSYFATTLMLAIFNQFLHLRASGHACGLVGPVMLLIYFMGGGAAWLALLLLPAIYWARLTTHRHTFSELIAGTLIGFIVTAGVLVSFFGLV